MNLSPFARVAFLFGFAGTTIWIRNPALLAVLALWAFLWWLYEGSWRFLATRLLIVAPFLAIGGLVATVTTDGQAMLLLAAIRLGIILIASAAVLGPLTNEEIGQGLVPMSSPRLASLIYLTLRSTASLAPIFQQLRQGIELRGSPSVARQPWLWGQLAARFLGRAFDQADQLSHAMTCRGFQGELPFLTRPIRSTPETTNGMPVGTTPQRFTRHVGLILMGGLAGIWLVDWFLP